MPKGHDGKMILSTDTVALLVRLAAEGLAAREDVAFTADRNGMGGEAQALLNSVKVDRDSIEVVVMRYELQTGEKL